MLVNAGGCCDAWLSLGATEGNGVSVMERSAGEEASRKETAEVSVGEVSATLTTLSGTSSTASTCGLGIVLIMSPVLPSK